MSDANDFGRDTAAGLARRKLEQTTLRRDVTATLVPEGDAVEIEAETEVTILQESDGGYTIQVPVLGATCRIAAADVDSLGKRLAERANREA